MATPKTPTIPLPDSAQVANVLKSIVDRVVTTTCSFPTLTQTRLFPSNTAPTGPPTDSDILPNVPLLPLAGTTPANATELRGSIKIQTDVKDQEEIVIPVSGYQTAPMPNMAKPSPAIAPNPSITKAPEKQLPPAGGSIPAGRPAAGDESKPAGPAQTAPGIKK